VILWVEFNSAWIDRRALIQSADPCLEVLDQAGGGSLFMFVDNESADTLLSKENSFP